MLSARWQEICSNNNSYGWILQVVLNLNKMKSTIFSPYLILDRITDSKGINGGLETVCPGWILVKKINKQGRVRLFRTQEYILIFILVTLIFILIIIYADFIIHRSLIDKSKIITKQINL